MLVRLEFSADKRRIAEDVAALVRRKDFLPVETERVAANDRRGFLEREAHEVLAEGFREANVHLVVHQPHGHFGDARRPLADLDAVEGIHVHEGKALDVQLRLPRIGIKQLENFDFQRPQFAVGNDEKIAAAARRVQKAESRDLFMESPQFGFVALGAPKFRA